VTNASELISVNTAPRRQWATDTAQLWV